MDLTKEEVAIIVAALRLWQCSETEIRAEFDEIAAGGGEIDDILDFQEIDGLIGRLTASN